MTQPCAILRAELVWLFVWFAYNIKSLMKKLSMDVKAAMETLTISAAGPLSYMAKL